MIPGTFGSLAGFFIFIILKGNPYVLFSVTSLTLIMGFLLSGKAARLFSQSDSPRIVIDEVSGMLISFLGLPVALLAGLNPALVSGFIIFRIIDTIKIYPANRFHRLQGSLGIMGDDIIAGLYTNLILRLIFLLK
ncbi:MAG: phosphatidylglycerophosphatase A [Candidatus Omnitrophica bacterium]|nr:phosphatidylglycerophosphatase A [Candidatus Omnitrophota bacterium]